MSEKASRYLSQLDAARCNGRWNDVPELARKVEKYLPSRKCLLLTARAEAKVATEPTNASTKGGNAEASVDSVPLYIKALRKAIEETRDGEDKFQAQTCLAWWYWNNNDYRSAKAIVPKSLPSSESNRKLSDWTTVCIVKAAFFRASSEEGLQNLREVPATYESCLNTLESLSAPALGIVEFCFWWERFFSRCCGCFYGIFQEQTKARARNIDTRACLQAYRAWASNWEHLAGTMRSDSPSAKQKRKQRLLVWQSYYHILSEILQHGYPYSSPLKTDPTQNGSGSQSFNKRKLLYLELSKVEAQYEGILQRQVSFPEASQINTEVDEWINSLMANWNVMCGPDWQEDDLGQGGKVAASRHVLESLYKAATLTFHSTSVLRHLFTLHTTLAEFTLAEKALDSYLEIVTKGKARVEKSGVAEPDLDSNELMLQTIVGGIEMLCEFGKARQVEKSIALSNRLLTWLDKNDNITTNGTGSRKSSHQSNREGLVSSSTIASAHRAVAISKASWARLTYKSRDRSKLQADAIKHLKIALRRYPTAEEEPSFLYPLALVLAETRNIEGAVAVIKQALTSESKSLAELADQKSFTEYSRTSAKSTSTVECWHLLSLLLSSRQEFETAESASQTSLEPYGGGSRSSLILDDSRKMSFFQKKQILEVKMTQIALAEINHGPQSAVNATAELLGSFSRFFESTKLSQPSSKMEKPPPTATGTIKSFRGSIFGRVRKSVRNSAVSLPQTNPAQEDPVPPTIAVTSDDSTTPRPISQAPARSPSHKLQKRRSRYSTRASRTASPARDENRVSTLTDGAGSDPVADADDLNRAVSSWSNDPSELGAVTTQEYPTVQTAQAISIRQAHPLQLDGNASSKSVRSPDVAQFSPELSLEAKQSLHIPAPIFSRMEEQRYSIALLNHIWLFISALYRRGGMLEDARQAMDEAFKQAKLAEAAVTHSGTSSIKAFDDPGWGGVKSVEEIWADSYAEMGHLCLAEGDPYEAMIKYEGALSHYPDHPSANVALANILLDIHAKKIPLARQAPLLVQDSETKEALDESSQPVFSKTAFVKDKVKHKSNGVNSAIVDDENEEDESLDLDGNKEGTVEELDLLASRDRAYTLLSNLTKLGSGWDDSNAWFALANAYEASGQVEKAKEVLWWVVELEDKQPVRHWRVLGQGYKLQR